MPVTGSFDVVGSPMAVDLLGLSGRLSAGGAVVEGAAPEGTPPFGREFELQMVDTLNRVESIMANVQSMINRQSVESKALLYKDPAAAAHAALLTPSGSFRLSRGPSMSSLLSDQPPQPLPPHQSLLAQLSQPQQLQPAAAAPVAVAPAPADVARLEQANQQAEHTIAELRQQLRRAAEGGGGAPADCGHAPELAALRAEVAELQAALKQQEAEWTARALADRTTHEEAEAALRGQVGELTAALHKARAQTADQAELQRQVEEARGEAEELRLQLDEVRARYEQELLEVREMACRDREEALANEACRRERDLQAERELQQRELLRLEAEKKDAITRHELLAHEREQAYSAERQRLDLQLEELQQLIDSKEQAIQGKDQRISLMENEFEHTLNKYQLEVRERRRIFNLLQEVRGNIRVFCRVRPLLASELAERPPVAYNPTFPEEHTICMHEPKEGATSSYVKVHHFEFDRVFTDKHHQADVYAEVAPLVTSVMDGFNACIFAYGQTGSGKTYTMEGYAPEVGINQRTLDELFHVARERTPAWEYRVGVSVLEIYNESVYDLLSQDRDPREKKIEIRMTKQGIALPDATVVPVNDSQSVLKVLTQGQRNRSVGQTDMNEHSSRSHCILSVYIEGHNKMAGQEVRGKLHLVDLAGSEKLAKSKATGDRLTESLHINKSLSALGDVIAALSKKEKHVPFRNSSLTFLLQDSLGGDSKTLMFVNISPSLYSVSESINSLNFASRVQKVELGKAKKHVRKLEDGPST